MSAAQSQRSMVVAALVLLPFVSAMLLWWLEMKGVGIFLILVGTLVAIMLPDSVAPQRISPRTFRRIGLVTNAIAVIIIITLIVDKAGFDGDDARVYFGMLALGLGISLLTLSDKTQGTEQGAELERGESHQ